MPIYEEPVIKPVSGYIVYVELCKGIELECNRKVHTLYYGIKKLIDEDSVRGIKELVPAYSSLTIFYDPREISWIKIKEIINGMFKELERESIAEVFKPRLFRIPVVYGGEFGPDLEESAKLAGLTIDEFIDIHTSRRYVCYMLGFTPGFIYLGTVDKRIAVPRLKTPRTRIPAGSVGIAGEQTGLYGVESPGGWRLIGRTPVRTFDPMKKPPTPIRPGDYVEFYRIDVKDYERLRGVWIEEIQ